ncbi:MAG TPA: PAS domain S-box protein [Blastocatellia bacterium]
MFKKSRFTIPSTILRYGSAVLAVAAATLLRSLLDPVLGAATPFPTYFVAALLIAWFAGLGPSLLSITAGGLLGWYLFMEPKNSFDIVNSADAVRLVLYFLLTGSLAFFIDAIHRARQRARKSSLALDENRERLRTILSSIGDAVIATDVDGYVIFMSGVAETLTGWTEEEAAGKPSKDLFTIVDQQTSPLMIARGGKEIPVEENASPLKDAAGNAVGEVLIFRDISERRKAEVALRKSEQELSDFFENANIGLQWTGRDRRVLRANPAQLSLLGYSRDEYLGRDAASFYVDQEVAEDVWQRLLRGEMITDREVSLQCKDGSIKYVLLSSNVRWEDGAFIYARCFSRDVTQRKLAEQALRESEERFRAMADTTPVMLWLAGSDGSCTFFNQTWLDFTGRSMQGEIGYGWAFNVHPDDLKRCLDAYTSALEARRSFEAEYRLRRVDGEYRWVLNNGVPRYTKEGEFIGFAGSCVDITDRRQAEEASRFLASLVESAEFAIIGKNLDGIILSWNPAAERMYGYTAEEAVGKHIGILAPRDRTDELSHVFEALRRGEPMDHLETKRRTKDGRLLDIALTVSPIRDETGQITGASTVARDITEQKRTERERSVLVAQVESERQRLNNLVAHVPGVVWESWGQPDSATQRIDFVSEHVEKMLGYSVDEWLEKPNFWLSIVHPDDKERAARDAAEIFASGKGGASVFRWVAKDRRVVWVESQWAVVCDEAGNPVGMRGVTMDITERKRAEDAQRFLADASAILSSSLDYETTLESIAKLAVPDLADWCTLDIVEEDGRLRQLAVAHVDPKRAEAARELQRRFPYDPEAPIGVPNVLRTGNSEFYPRIDPSRIELAVGSKEFATILRKAGLKSCIIVPLVARNRTLGAMTLLTAESGRNYDQADLALAEDLAERIALAVDNARLYRGSQEALVAREEALQLRDDLLKREHAAREEAEGANRAKDEFLATVSHELRTPLNAILGWAHMLSGNRLDTPTRSRALETIERNAKSQAQLIDDILDVSRIVTGKLRLDVQPVELASVVEAAVDAVRPAADAKDIRIETILDPRAGPVSGDPDRLQQVVWNLAANAVKFTNKRGRVQVRLERVDSHVEITVSDTGQGISPEFLPYVFDRFRQADATSTRRHGGLGLGLAIVRHLVEMHGGSVIAASPGEGQGTTFIVNLPIMIVHGELREPASVHPTAGGTIALAASPLLDGLRVLVVDDEPDTLAMLEIMIGEFGAEVRCCSSAAEALEAMDDFRPDVLVSDIEMPGEDGYQLIAKIRARDKERGAQTPAVALTAYARAEDRVRALAAGYQMHLAKPFEPAELAVVIASVAGRTVRGSAV